jgi:type IV secretory pathway TrbD component
VTHMSADDGRRSVGHVYAAAPITALGHCGVAAFVAYVGGVLEVFVMLRALAGLGVLVDWYLISFLASAVALARLASVFSKLVRRIWRALSSLTGAVLAVLPFGMRDWISGLFVKSCMMWAVARIDSSWGTILVGCMTLRYARHKLSMLARESWLGGTELRSYFLGKGRKLENLIICIAGIVVQV